MLNPYNMEVFVEEVKKHVCLDINKEELQDIRDSTRVLLQRLSDSLGHVNSHLKVEKIVPCGSMEEGTRNWKFSSHNKEPVVEFDFLAVLNQTLYSELSHTECCSGYMKVIDNNKQLLPYCFNSPESGVQGDRISFSFSFDIMKSVNYICNCFNFDAKMKFLQKDECCKYVVHGTVSKPGAGCELCTEHRSSGFMQLATGDDVGSPYYNNCSVVLKWTSKSHFLQAPDPSDYTIKRNQDHLYVLVDFVPAFEVQTMEASVQENDTSVKAPVLIHECYLVPKLCKWGHNTCWRISNCDTEIRLLKSASQDHRYAYMILKFISEIVFSGYIQDGSVPTTYEIKMVVLHHINTCKICVLSTCIQNLLDDLATCFSQQSLSHFVNGSNLLQANTRGNLPVQNNTWHRNRCNVVSQCFYFILKLLGSKEEYTLKTCIKPLKYIGKAFHLAWSQTEVDTVYSVDQEKLKSFLTIMLHGSDQGGESDLSDADFSSLLIKQSSPRKHWTGDLKVWEYEGVREMYQRHHHECPDPPGKTATQDEKILRQAQIFCGFHSWSHEEQEKWKSKLANSEDPDNIVMALRAVDMYYVDTKRKTKRENQEGE
jgi:hypothetical protein